MLSGNGKIHSGLAYGDFGIREGDKDKVLDIGCGFGETALEIAKLVGPNGEVVGIDCTDAFVDVANGERDEAGEDGQRKLPEIRRELGELMGPHLRTDGVFMPSSTWAIMAGKS